MKIRELINLNLISLDLNAETKDGVIFELADNLHKDYRIENLKEFINEINKREELGSTGIGFGIAIPHAKSKYVMMPSLAFGRSLKGIDYESLDGELASIFFMIAMPENGSNLHLKALSLLSRSLIHEEFRQSLLNAKSKQEVLDILKTIDKEE
jgi:fructose-specific phosphotransferase system IIA component